MFVFLFYSHLASPLPHICSSFFIFATKLTDFGAWAEQVNDQWCVSWLKFHQPYGFQSAGQVNSWSSCVPHISVCLRVSAWKSYEEAYGFTKVVASTERQKQEWKGWWGRSEGDCPPPLSSQTEDSEQGLVLWLTLSGRVCLQTSFRPFRTCGIWMWLRPNHYKYL